MKPLHPLLKAALLVAIIFTLCEFLIYYLVIFQCSWPSVTSDKGDGANALRAFFISDTHLLGNRGGHWFDKLRREWQMTRCFQSAMSLLHPDAVFVLGDLTDEGKWAKDTEFDDTVQRFWTMFYHGSDVEFHVVAGNHDIGFHDYVPVKYRDRFEVKFDTPSVKIITIKDIVFVLVNSMTMHTDGCAMCSLATEQLKHASRQLNCSRFGSPDGKSDNSNLSQKCNSYNKMPNVGPILLQHFPLWRESDAMCTGVDSAPADEKFEKFREGWGALPADASQRLLSLIKPRLILSGHTHYGCYVLHDEAIPEISVPSFSWRNLNNPSIVLATITKDNFEIKKCFLPRETTVEMIYALGATVLVVYFFINIRNRRLLYGLSSQAMIHGKIL